jgi:hypothetical protein
MPYGQTIRNRAVNPTSKPALSNPAPQLSVLAGPTTQLTPVTSCALLFPNPRIPGYSGCGLISSGAPARADTDGNTDSPLKPCVT